MSSESEEDESDSTSGSWEEMYMHMLGELTDSSSIGSDIKCFDVSESDSSSERSCDEYE
jgi:hypothetical protein